MDSAWTRRSGLPALTIPSGLILMWLAFGPSFVALWVLFMLVFLVGPLWLGHVYGKPYAERRRRAGRQS